MSDSLERCFLLLTLVLAGCGESASVLPPVAPPVVVDDGPLERHPPARSGTGAVEPDRIEALCALGYLE